MSSLTIHTSGVLLLKTTQQELEREYADIWLTKELN